MPINIALAPASGDEIDLTEAAAEKKPPSEKTKKPVRPLSDPVRRFVHEYVRDLDATAAARRAGFPRSNAAYWAAATLRRPEVQEAVEQALAERAARLHENVSAARIIAEVTRIAFADPGRIARWTPEGIQLIHSVDLTDDDRAAVKRITLGPPRGRGKGKRAQLFEMHDKLSALELLARLIGMLPRGKQPSHIDATRERRDANAILRERLMKIVRQGEKKEADK